MNVRKLLAAVALGAGIAVAAALPAWAITPGTFCKESAAGQVQTAADGDTYVCSTAASDSRYRWRPIGATATPTATHTVNPRPGHTGYPTAHPTKTVVTVRPTRSPSPAVPSEPQLPKTGSNSGGLAIGGGLVLIGGAGLVVAARARRRRRFTA